MSRNRVALRAAAVHDIEGAVDRYRAEAGESVALSFVGSLEHSVARVRHAPHAGTLRFSYELGIPNLRAVPLPRFPYVMFYVVEEDRVDVWRVLHSRRDLPAELTVDG